MNKFEEKNLHSLFSKLADQSLKKSPTFDHMWERARFQAIQKKRRIFRRKLALAASIIVLIGSFFIVDFSDPNEVDTTESIALLQWESPTEVLLDGVIPIYQDPTLPTEAILKFLPLSIETMNN